MSSFAGRRGAANKDALRGGGEADSALQEIWAAHRLAGTVAAGPAMPAAVTGTGNAYDSTLLVASGAASVAFSPDETRIYVARYDGNLDVFDAASGQKLATWDIGHSLGGLSVSEDGGFLLVVERFNPPHTPGGPFPPPPGPPVTSTFYRVDTATGAATAFTRDGSAYLDVEIVDGDTVILTGGQPQVTIFDLTTNAYLTLPGAIDYSNNSVLVEDEHYTLFAEGGISSGPLLLFDDRTGTIVARGDNYQTLGQNSGQTGFNFGHQAISEAGGLVAQFIYHSTINLFDLNLDFIRGFSVTGPVDGLAFDMTGKFLFARTGTQLNMIDIATGAIVDNFSVLSAPWHNNMGSGDQIVLSEDGKTILVKDNSTGQLQLIDLRIRDELFAGTAEGDAFAGGKGDDTYLVNHAGDTITELLYDGTDLAIASVDYTIQQYVENLTLTGGAVRGTGNALANRIEGTDGANLLQGMAGNDQLFGLGGGDVLEGGEGNDVIRGGAGQDAMTGGAGDDWYFVDDGDSVVEGALEGNADRVFASTSYTLTAGAHIEILSTDFHGGTAAINLTGNALANFILGNAGNNILDGKGGADTLVGFGGDDWFFVDHAGDYVVEGASEGTGDRVFASVSYTLAPESYVEILSTDFHAGTGAIDLSGNALVNLIFGNAGNNRLDGRGGADTLVGFGGDDWFFVDHAGDLVVEGASEGTADRVFASVSYTLAPDSHVEILSTDFHAGTGAIDLSGNALVNLIFGNAGNNRLDGRGGADTLVGFGGNDFYFVDHAGDLIVEGASEGTGDRVFASVSYTLAPDAHVEIMSTDFHGGTAAIDLSGNGLANLIYGNAGGNRLDGRGGADTMIGFGGDDVYLVDNAGDVVVEGSTEGTGDRVLASTSYTLTAGAHIELLSTDFHSGTAAIDLSGNEFANLIYGNAGGNRLDGKGGSDALVGFGGADTFAFTTALGAGNVDIIADFDADDTIALDDAVFTGLTAGSLNANAFVIGTQAQDADDRILYDQATGRLFYDADGNGSGEAILFATLSGAPTLTVSDFAVI